MDVKAARNVSGRTDRSVFDRLRGQQQYVKNPNKVCVYWLQGRCRREPCRFLHSDAPPLPKKSRQPPSHNRPKTTWKNPKYHGSKNETVPTGESMDVEGTAHKLVSPGGAVPGNENAQTIQQKLCQYWVTGNCVYGDKCRDLHSWFSGSGFSMLTMLEGDSKAITGIALPPGSDKLYSLSRDGSLRLWDCHSGQCAGTIKLECETECLLTEGPWVFVGTQKFIKAWNLQNQKEFVLGVPVGKVCSMVADKNTLFAGLEDGLILAWKLTSELICHEPFASLEGHNDNVVSLFVGANRLYSGSRDNTIRVWDLESLQNLHTLHGHSSVVTSILCWDSYLLSGSLDRTLKVWAATENGKVEVVYEQKEESGILTLCGIHDAEAKPILLCSCKDKRVLLYDLPSFGERGRIFARRDVHSIQIGPDGLFFTGDGTGQVAVWKLLPEPSSIPS